MHNIITHHHHICLNHSVLAHLLVTSQKVHPPLIGQWA